MNRDEYEKLKRKIEEEKSIKEENKRNNNFQYNGNAIQIYIQKKRENIMIYENRKKSFLVLMIMLVITFCFLISMNSIYKDIFNSKLSIMTTVAVNDNLNNSYQKPEITVKYKFNGEDRYKTEKVNSKINFKGQKRIVLVNKNDPDEVLPLFSIIFNPTIIIITLFLIAFIFIDLITIRNIILGQTAIRDINNKIYVFYKDGKKLDVNKIYDEIYKR